MRLVDRYIVVTIVRHFAYALAGLLAVFFVINLTEELRSVGSSWSVRQALRFVLLTLPAEAYTLFPASALLGSVLALGRMAGDSEIVALEAAGVSPWRIALAALLAAVVLAVAGIGFGEVVAAPMSQRAHGQRALALSGGRALSTASGLWLRDGTRFVNIGALRPDGSLSDLYLFDFDARHQLERFARAQAAAPAGDGWQLQNLRESTFGEVGATNRTLDRAPWHTSIDPHQIRALYLEPRDLSLTELYLTIHALRERGQNAFGHEVAFWRRVSAPVYMGVMVLLAVPLVLVSGRSVRVGERAMLGALIGLGFQMFQEMFTNLGLVAGLPPLVTALAPAVAALALVAALFRRQGAR